MTQSSRIKVKITRLPHSENLPLPAYQTEGAAGLDLVAALEAASPLFLAPGARSAIPTGLAFEIPLGYEAQVRPRSGLALKQGLTVLNSPGTIDSDYRGEIQVILINLSSETATIRRGERIAQVVFAPVTLAELVEAPILSETTRGAGGFGSTGLSAKADENSKPKKPKKKKNVPAKGALKEQASKPNAKGNARRAS